jgi:hypothetical protein
MGGVARIFKSLGVSTGVIKLAQPDPATRYAQNIASGGNPATALAAGLSPTTAATNIAQKATLAGGTYGGQTILSSSQGDEKEANVSKTILGGGKKKNIKS